MQNDVLFDCVLASQESSCQGLWRAKSLKWSLFIVVSISHLRVCHVTSDYVDYYKLQGLARGVTCKYVDKLVSEVTAVLLSAVGITRSRDR